VDNHWTKDPRSSPSNSFFARALLAFTLVLHLATERPANIAQLDTSPSSVVFDPQARSKTDPAVARLDTEPG